MEGNKFSFVSGLISVGAFIYLMWFLKHNAIPINLATWGLWAILDISITISMFKTNNFGKWMMSSFAFGATTIALMAVLQILEGKTSWIWTSKESITLVCFVIAFMVSQFSKNKELSVNMGTTAMFIAGVPTLIDAWNQPTSQNAIFWGISTVACAVMLMGRPKGFTQSYLPIGGTILNGFITALALGWIK